MRILISACRSERSVMANNVLLYKLGALLFENDVPFEVAVGCYPEDGQQVSTEVTYVCHLNTEGWPMEDIDRVAQEYAQMAAARFQQECVGVVYDGEFYLSYPNAPLEHVGRFTEQPAQPKGKPCTLYRGKWYMAEKAA